MDEKYIALQDFVFEWFFIDQDIKVSNDDLVLIKPLAKTFSCSLWEKYISSNRPERHYMLLNNNILSIDSTNVLYYWLDDWNNDHIESFAKILQETIDYSIDDEILIFWMKEHSVKTYWRIFLKYWINFLFEDEGVIIINPKNKKTIILSNGCSWIVKR